MLYVCKLLKMAGEPCKPDSVPHGPYVPVFSLGRAYHAAAIIPLGHDSHRDSSSLPEGFHLRRLAPPQKERVHFHER